MTNNMNTKHLKDTSILFEFKGDISKKCRRYLLHKLAVRLFVTVLVSMAVCMPLCILVISAILGGEMDVELLRILCPVLGGLCLAFSGLGMVIPYTKTEQKELFPVRICFYGDEDNTVVIETVNGRSIVKKVEYSDKFRKIVDMGDFYYIDIPFRSGRGYICEKALMTRGTAEEFYKHFEEKIVRKDKE